MISIRVDTCIYAQWELAGEDAAMSKYWERLHRDRFGTLMDEVWPPDLERSLYIRKGKAVHIPTGLLGNFLTFLTDEGLQYSVQDNRMQATGQFARCPELRDYQETPCRSLLSHQGGILIAPPGSGKTVMSMFVIAAKAQSALWLTHSPELAFQVAEKAHRFLGIDRFERVHENSGFYFSPSFTIAVPRTKESDRLLTGQYRTGILVVDEAHKLEDPSIALVANNSLASIRIGLTASAPPVLATHLIGPVTSCLRLHDLRQVRSVVLPKYMAIGTQFAMAHTPSVEHAIDEAAKDPLRLEQICGLALSLANEGHRVLVLSSRKAHCKAISTRLQQSLGEQVCTMTSTGQSQAERLRLFRAVESGVKRVVIGDHILSEGLDLPSFDRLVLALPTPDYSMVLQQAGRLMRPAANKRDAVVFDLVDSAPECLLALSQKRYRYLKEALRWAT